MAKEKKTVRKLRLTTPVNPLEKQRAEKIAKAEGFDSVAELVRKLLSERHKARALAKKEAKLLGSSLPALKLGKTLALGSTRRTAKPARSGSARKRTSGSTASSTPKKLLNGRVVTATGKNVGRPAGRTAKRSAAANRLTKLG